MQTTTTYRNYSGETQVKAMATPLQMAPLFKHFLILNKTSLCVYWVTVFRLQGLSCPGLSIVSQQELGDNRKLCRMNLFVSGRVGIDAFTANNSCGS